MKLFDYSYLAHLKVLWQAQNVCVTVQFLLRGGDLTEGFFALRVRGGFYLKGLLHRGAYFQNVTVFQSKGGTIIQGKWLIKGWLLFEEIQ